MFKNLVISTVTLVAVAAQANTISLQFADGALGTCTVEAGALTLSAGQLSARCTELASAFLAAPGAQDNDGDGVADSSDQCPNTSAGSQVDTSGQAAGCSAAQKLVDTDGDTVPDYRDDCPNQPIEDPQNVVLDRGCLVTGGGGDVGGTWGVAESGVGVTYDAEVAGKITETVYVPNKANPALVIYEGIKDLEIVYPGCAATPTGVTCKTRGTLDPDVVYAQRVRREDRPYLVSFRTNDTGDWLLSYDVVVTAQPKANQFEGLPLYTGGACGALKTMAYGVRLSSCSKVGAGPVAYAMFRAADNPRWNRVKAGCGKQVCRMKLEAQ